MERLVREFVAYDEQGKAVTILEFEEVIDITTLADPGPRYMGGQKRLALRSGGHVNLIDGQTFVVVESGRRLTLS